MRIFLDTEFTGLTQQTSLISLALVDENERTFYAEFTDFEASQVTDWLQENVLKNLFLDAVGEVTTEGAFTYMKCTKVRSTPST